MGNLASAEATTFWILNSEYFTGKPIFSMMRAYLRLASWHSSSERAPVITILPLLKISPVVLGLRRRMITAANLFGLYSVALPFQVISLRSSLHPRLTVPTTFWILGRQASGIFIPLFYMPRFIIIMGLRTTPPLKYSIPLQSLPVSYNILHSRPPAQTYIIKLSMISIALLTLLVVSQQAEPTLDKHVIPLYGNATLGYYYANIYVGTPPQEQSVIVDTGSGQLALPCSKCVSCGIRHIHPPFRMGQSKTSQYMTCNSDEQICQNSCNRKSGSEACTFSISYAEGSSLSGIIIQDEIQFERDSAGESIITAFGCTTKETNLFYTQAANGIFGLAPKRQARLLDKLYQKHSKSTGQQFLFSLCLSKNGGQLVVGRTKPEIHTDQKSVKVRYSGDRNLYSLEQVGEMRMGDTVVKRNGESSGGFGIFIDSGSTFTYLPRSNYKNLELALSNACAKSPQRCLIAQSRSSCFKIIPEKDKTIRQTLLGIFPSLDIEIGSETVSWAPSRYFLLKSLKNGEVCLGIEALDRYILGANWMVDRDIVFNIHQGTVQIFSNSICSLDGSDGNISRELPVYAGDSSESLSYIQAVFRMDSNLLIIIIIVVITIGFVMLILGIIGKFFGQSKAANEGHDEEKEEIKAGQLSEKRMDEMYAREGSSPVGEQIVTVSLKQMGVQQEESDHQVGAHN